MKNVRLSNGVMMPAIGFGVFQIPENETERAVNDAIEIGYRKFDTAAAYFNEEQLGNAIRQSGIKREEFFITTKLWVQDYEYDDALRAFDLSMKKLGLDYLDLYLMHKPYGNYYAASPRQAESGQNHPFSAPPHAPHAGRSSQICRQCRRGGQWRL